MLMGLSCCRRALMAKSGARCWAGQHDAADIAAQKICGVVFHSVFYIEITRHHGGVVGANEQRIEQGLIDLAYKHNLPLVATNDVHFGRSGYV